MTLHKTKKVHWIIRTNFKGTLTWQYFSTWPIKMFLNNATEWGLRTEPRLKATSRDRPKSAPYLRLKNSKTSKHSLLQHPKKFLEKVSQCRKKLNGGPFGIFQHPFSKKIERGPFGGKKSHSAEKTKGDPLVSIGTVCYAKKRKSFFGSVTWSKRYNLEPSFKFCRTFSRTILVTSGGPKKQHWRTAMTIVDIFSQEKRRLKIRVHNKSMAILGFRQFIDLLNCTFKVWTLLYTGSKPKTKTRRERLKSALNLRLKQRKVFENQYLGQKIII